MAGQWPWLWSLCGRLTLTDGPGRRRRMRPLDARPDLVRVQTDVSVVVPHPAACLSFLGFLGDYYEW